MNLISLQQAIQMDLQGFALIVLFIALAGFISGFSGFGFSAVGVAVLWKLSPTRAIPLLMALSIANQLLSINQLKKETLPLTEWWSKGPASYMLGGLFGIPIGIWIMSNLPAVELTFATGIILVIYSAWMFTKPHGKLIHKSSVLTHLIVGMIGGAIGGFTAFLGSALVIWAGLCGFSKTEAVNCPALHFGDTNRIISSFDI